MYDDDTQGKDTCGKKPDANTKNDKASTVAFWPKGNEMSSGEVPENFNKPFWGKSRPAKDNP
jgi:hypothetical protein